MARTRTVKGGRRSPPRAAVSNNVGEVDAHSPVLHPDTLRLFGEFEDSSFRIFSLRCSDAECRTTDKHLSVYTHAGKANSSTSAQSSLKVIGLLPQGRRGWLDAALHLLHICYISRMLLEQTCDLHDASASERIILMDSILVDLIGLWIGAKHKMGIYYTNFQYTCKCA